MSKFVNNLKYGQDTLLLQSYYTDYVNVLENGVSLDGTDQLANIQSIIDSNPNKTIYFPDGTYNISGTINTSAQSNKRVVLQLSRYAILKATESFPASSYMVDIGGNDSFDANDGVPLGISGGIIDTNYRASGIKIEKSHMAFIRDLVIRNLSYVGIDIEQSQNPSADAQVRNVIVYGQLLLSTNVGMILNSTDNNINTFRTMHTGKGIVINRGGNIFYDCHVLCSADTMTNYEDTIGFEINEGNNQFDNIYSDNYSTGIKFTPNAGYNVVGHFFSLWYSASAGHTHAFFSGAFNNNVIDTVQGYLPSYGDNYIWNYTDTDLGRESQLSDQFNGIQITQNKIILGAYSLKYPLTDYGFLTKRNIVTNFNGGDLAGNTWLPVGVFVLPSANTPYNKVEVALGWDSYSTIYFNQSGVKKVVSDMFTAAGRKFDAVLTSVDGQGGMTKRILWIRPNFGAEKRAYTKLINGWCKQFILPRGIGDIVPSYAPTTDTPPNVVGSIVSGNGWQ